jgi:hypothetical protein
MIGISSMKVIISKTLNVLMILTILGLWQWLLISELKFVLATLRRQGRIHPSRGI